MAFATGEVVATPSEETPFKVVVSLQGETWDIPVGSIVEGEALIIEALQGLRLLAKADGDVK